MYRRLETRCTGILLPAQRYTATVLNEASIARNRLAGLVAVRVEGCRQGFRDYLLRFYVVCDVALHGKSVAYRH